MIVRRTWSSCKEEVSAFPNSWKTATSPASRCSPETAGLRRRSTAGNCFASSTLGWSLKWMMSRFKPERRAGHNTTAAIRGEPANLGQYRHQSKRGARISWYRRGHLAIGGNRRRRENGDARLMRSQKRRRLAQYDAARQQIVDGPFRWGHAGVCAIKQEVIAAQNRYMYQQLARAKTQTGTPKVNGVAAQISNIQAQQPFAERRVPS